MNSFREVYEYRTMIQSMVKRTLRGRYQASVLGFAWSFLNPLLQLGVYTVVFSVIMRAGIEQYYLFLFVALIPWIFFGTSVSEGASCIVANSNLVQKIYFPRVVLPISHVIAQFINMLLSFIVVMVVVLISGRGITPILLLYIPAIMIAEFVLALAMTLLFSAITVYVRDLEYVASILMMAWQFLTPVMYSETIVPENLQFLYSLNPMTPIIIAYRDVLYYRQAPKMQTLLIGGAVSIVLFIIGWLVFQCAQKKFAEEL